MRRVVMAALVMATVPLSAQDTAARPMRALQPADLHRLRTVDDPQRSSDGAWVAYTVSRIDSMKDRHDKDIYLTSWDGATTRRLTTSDENESKPRWSPDAKSLTFLSARQGAKGGQLWMIPRDGGEAEQLTHLAGGVSDYAWSPNGTALVLVVTDTPATVDTSRPQPIVVDRYAFKRDGEGYLSPERSHLYLFSWPARTLTPLTRGAYDDHSPSWSPDGRLIAFVSAREANAERTNNEDVYVIEARAEAEPRALTTFKGADTGPLSWSPDGTRLAYLQGPEPRYDGYSGGLSTLGVVSLQGGAPTLLTQRYDRAMSEIVWSLAGVSVLGIADDDQDAFVVRVAMDGSVTRINTAIGVAHSFSQGRADGGLAVTAATPTHPAELYAVEGSRVRRLTSHNAWIGSVQLATLERVSARSDDGTEVHGVLRRPAGVPATARVPLVVRIHGGPAAQDAMQFDFEREVLAAQGWAVLSPNYRGSSGRGSAYTTAIAGDWCNKEVRDIRGMVNAMIARGIADSTRMGVSGWSYGGILTDCLIATDTRFKGAISGAGVSNFLGMYGHDQYVVQYDQEMGAPWKNPEKWIKASVGFFKADKIKTPTLFMGGAADWNVPILGSEHMYQALKSVGTETQLVVYPGETHEIRRPSFQRDRLERIVRWYRGHLLGTVQ